MTRVIYAIFNIPNDNHVNTKIYICLTLQIVNPVSNISDEDAVFYDEQSGKSFSARRDSIQVLFELNFHVILLNVKVAGIFWNSPRILRDLFQFPIVFTSNVVSMQYMRSYGPPKLIVLVLFLDGR